jgi:hypothetical protein
MTTPAPEGPDRQALVRAAAHEVLLRRLLADLESFHPGTLDRLAGPYRFAGRPEEAMAAFAAEVDDHVSLLLSQVRADLRER